MKGIPVVPLVDDAQRRDVLASGFDLGVRHLEVRSATSLEHLGCDDAAHRQDQPAHHDERHDQHDGAATVVDGPVVTRSLGLFAHDHVDEP